MNENIAKIREILSSEHTLKQLVKFIRLGDNLTTSYLKQHVSLNVIDRTGGPEKEAFPNPYRELLYNGKHQCFLYEKRSERFRLNILNLLEPLRGENWPLYEIKINPESKVSVPRPFFIDKETAQKLGFTEKDWK